MRRLKKSTVIALCLINGRIIYRMEDAQEVIRRIFADEFPGESYDVWNGEVSEVAAQELIRSVEARGYRLDVETLIRELWDAA